MHHIIKIKSVAGGGVGDLDHPRAAAHFCLLHSSCFFPVTLVQLQSRVALQTLLMTDERLLQKHQSTATPAQAAKISGPFGPATIDDCIQDRGCSTKS